MGTERTAARLGSWTSWPNWARIGLLVGVAAALGAGLLPRGGDDRGGPATTTIAPASQDYAMGTTARSATFDIIVHGFSDPQPPGAFLRPAAGTHYVSVDVQVVNRGTVPQTFSSLAQIHLVDRANRQFEPTFGDLEPPAPDGEIPPGATSRGHALFEVPDGATGLRVRVRGDLTTPGVVFTLG